MPDDLSAKQSIERLAFLYSLGEIALKRMLIDGNFLSADNSFYQKTISRSVAESVRNAGTLSIDLDADGQIIVEYKGFTDSPEGQ